jgi:hypothetical protein
VRTTDILSAIDRLAEEGAREFNDTTDFFWKAPTLIEHQTQIEKAKLHEYFPDDMSRRFLRWQLESRKLGKTFPYLMSAGNVFTVLSLFETFFTAPLPPDSGSFRGTPRGHQGTGNSALPKVFASHRN